MSCWSVCVCLEKKFRKSVQTCDLRGCCVARSDLPQILTVSDDAAAGEAGLSLGSAQPRAASVPPVSSCQPRAQGTGRPRLIQADAKFMPISVPLDAKNITITHRHDSILKIFNFLKLNNIHSVRCLSAPASVKLNLLLLRDLWCCKIFLNLIGLIDLQIIWRVRVLFKGLYQYPHRHFRYTDKGSVWVKVSGPVGNLKSSSVQVPRHHAIN